MIERLAALAWLAGALFAQAGSAPDGHRMEIMLDRLESDSWRAVDPGLVLERSDRVRFRFRTNFDGYLYVLNQSTSGKYEQLFPRQETGHDNRIEAGQEYQVPATSSVFRIAGPAGHEIVYWLVSPAPLGDQAWQPATPSTSRPPRPALSPRCDDAILRARGDCIDNGAGLKLIPRDAQLPQNLAGAASQTPEDLLVLRQKDASVVSSPAPLAGPVVYEFRLAHR
jgi:Domain of unknown function (DUF4384)